MLSDIRRFTQKLETQTQPVELSEAPPTTVTDRGDFLPVCVLIGPSFDRDAASDPQALEQLACEGDALRNQTRVRRAQTGRAATGSSEDTDNNATGQLTRSAGRRLIGCGMKNKQ